MLLTVSNGVAADSGSDGTAPLRIAVLLCIMFGTSLWWYRRSTRESRRLVATIAQRGIESGASLVPPPVLFGDREAAVADGVDLGPLHARDPGFTALELLSIARETLSLVRKARAEQVGELADGLLDETLRAALDTDIIGDVTAGRHHLFPMLDIAASSVVACGVDTTGSSVTVRHSLTGTEVERSDETGAVVVGDAMPMHWEESWTFRRALDVDGAEIDRIKTHTAGGWLIPHRGWRVANIEVGDREPSPVGEPGALPTPPGANKPAPGAAEPEPGSSQQGASAG